MLPVLRCEHQELPIRVVLLVLAVLAVLVLLVVLHIRKDNRGKLNLDSELFPADFVLPVLRCEHQELPIRVVLLVLAVLAVLVLLVVLHIRKDNRGKLNLDMPATKVLYHFT